MRDEWFQPIVDKPMIDSEDSSSHHSTQGLTHRQPERVRSSKPSMTNLSLAMASRAMRLKRRETREVSERRQVGDAEEMVNGSDSQGNAAPWWKNVTMEEGM